MTEIFILAIMAVLFYLLLQFARVQRNTSRTVRNRILRRAQRRDKD